MHLVYLRFFPFKDEKTLVFRKKLSQIGTFDVAIFGRLKEARQRVAFTFIFCSICDKKKVIFLALKCVRVAH